MSGYHLLGMPVNVSLWTLIVIIVALVLLAGLMAGLIISVFSLDPTRLRALAQRPETVEGRRAQRLLRIVNHQHWLLVTLVVVDSAATEMLPLLFNILVTPTEAVGLSVMFLVVFGEIVPEAVFTHHALALSAALVYPVWALMVITAPVSWPIGKFLDRCVGNRSSVAFKRGQLREVIRYRAERLDEQRGSGEVLEAPRESELDTQEPYAMQLLEMQIMLGVLSLSEHVGSSVLKQKIDTVFTVHRDAIVSKRMIQSIAAHKLTYIPVYGELGHPSNVTHVFELRLLLFFAYCSEDNLIRVRDLPLLPLPRYSADTPCNELLDHLRASPLQVAALTSSRNAEEVIGMVSATDVAELVHRTSFDATFLEPHHFRPDSVVQSFRAHNASSVHNTHHMAAT